MFESYLAPAAGVALHGDPASVEILKGNRRAQCGGAGLFDCWRARIDELLDGHAGMGVVERVIDEADVLDADEKDALWLWARGRRDRLVSAPSERPIIGGTAGTESRYSNHPMAYPKGAGHDQAC